MRRSRHAVAARAPPARPTARASSSARARALERERAPGGARVARASRRRRSRSARGCCASAGQRVALELEPELVVAREHVQVGDDAALRASAAARGSPSARPPARARFTSFGDMPSSQRTRSAPRDLEHAALRQREQARRARGRRARGDASRRHGCGPRRAAAAARPARRQRQRAVAAPRARRAAPAPLREALPRDVEVVLVVDVDARSRRPRSPRSGSSPAAARRSSALDARERDPAPHAVGERARQPRRSSTPARCISP